MAFPKRSFTSSQIAKRFSNKDHPRYLLLQQLESLGRLTDEWALTLEQLVKMETAYISVMLSWPESLPN